MAKSRRKSTSFKMEEMDLKEAQRAFSRSRGRGSKYDDVIDAAEKLDKGKALFINDVTYSEVTGIRNRIRDILGDDWAVSSTLTDRDKKLYDVIVHRE